MKEDFKRILEKLSRIGILRISNDFYMEPERRGSIFFVKSPATKDRTKSLALYPDTNSFHDFAGNKTGDCIGFVSYIQGINNWESMKLLSGFYGLSEFEEKKQKTSRQNIQEQQKKEQEKKQRNYEFQCALIEEINHLKQKEQIYKAALEESKIKPFSNLWVQVQNNLQKISYKLDILCCSDPDTYRRMKPNDIVGINSDRPQWLLDVLKILKESGKFQATQDEILKIKKHRDIELKRKPLTNKGVRLW